MVLEVPFFIQKKPFLDGSLAAPVFDRADVSAKKGDPRGRFETENSLISINVIYSQWCTKSTLLVHL